MGRTRIRNSLKKFVTAHKRVNCRLELTNMIFHELEVTRKASMNLVNCIKRVIIRDKHMMDSIAKY